MRALTPFTIILLSQPLLLNAQATILYPDGGLTVNNIDTVDVQYESEWGLKINITIFCLIPQADDPTNYAFYGDANNPIPANGIQQLSDIQGDMEVSSDQWPIDCHINLADAGGSNSSINGGDFIMTSTGGLPSTYQLSASSITSSATSSTPTSSSSTSTSAPSAYTATVTVQPTRTPSPTSSPTPAAGLSTGAKAGIGIGCALGALALLGAAYLLISRHRRRRGVQQRNIPEMDHVGSNHGYAQGNHIPPQELGSDEPTGPGPQRHLKKKATQPHERYELGG